MLLLTHGDSKLIHDAAVDTVEFILRELADQRQILIAYLETEEITQDRSCQHLYGCRGRKSGSIGNITV